MAAPLSARRAAAGRRPWALRDRCAAHLGRIHPSGDRRQAGAAGARSVGRRRRMLDVLARPDDIVMGFGPPAGDPALHATGSHRPAPRRAGLPVARPARRVSSCPPRRDDPFVHQEMTELMYHTLWETVHVFFEQRDAATMWAPPRFCIPSWAAARRPADTLADVARLDRPKSRRGRAAAQRVCRSRCRQPLADAALAIARAIRRRRHTAGLRQRRLGHRRQRPGAGLPRSARRACGRCRPFRCPWNRPTSARIGNDVGIELVFLRQLIANGRPGDIAVAISTSGKSKNICAALVEARKRGMLTMALLGYDGGDIVRQQLADYRPGRALRLHSADSGNSGLDLSRRCGRPWRCSSGNP